ncbi:MAG TPA: phage antirepressor N-terminal domain-containing protein [Ktedonobacterales bacterium]|nr:phage antirepressor N-terminal domain-containing protein [Ktedonobacterales bacterium]
MSNKSSQAIIPLEQAVIPFHNGEIMGVHLPGNLIAAVLSSLCALLGITPHGQAQRIRRDEELSKHLLLAVIQTPGGPQRVDVLAVGAIPSWLMGINRSLIAPEKRALALALQFEAADALYRHFFGADTEQAAQPAAKKLSEPDGAPGEWVEAEPTSSLPDTIWERQYEVMAGFEREWQTMKQDIAGLKTELTEIRQQLRGTSAAGQTQRDNRPLSLEHIMQLYTLARALESQSGEPISALLRQLAEVFDVTDASAIPDASWEHVLTWFWQHASTN